MIRKIIKSIGLLIALFYIGLSSIYLISRHNLLSQLEATSHIAETAVGPIQYSIIGNEGPVILHIHGTPGGFNHTPFFTTTGFEEYRLLTPSRPGYLDTPLEVGETPEEQARAYVALLDTLQINEVIIMPVSGGGPSAISFASLYPDRTKAFIGLEIASQSFPQPLEIPAFMKSDFLWWIVASTISNLGHNFISGEFAEKLNNSPDGNKRFKEFLWSPWPLSPKIEGWQNDSRQFMDLALTPQLIKAPTLLLHGTDDQSAPYESAQWLDSQIPDSRLHTINGVGHIMLLSHKDELNAVINTFLHDALHEENLNSQNNN